MYKSIYKKDYIENKIIEFINKGYSRLEAELEAEEWWEEVTAEEEEI